MLLRLAPAVIVLAYSPVFAQTAGAQTAAAQSAGTQTLAAPQTLCDVQPLNGQWPATAQFIAGLNEIPGGTLPADQSRSWSDFSKVSSTDWRNLQKRYLSRVDAWRGRSLANVPGQQVAFYPFGGPDAANLLAFFPDAQRYIVIGLEPVGCIPTNLADYTPEYFAELRTNLSSVVANGFFRTKEMGGNFKQGSVNGVLPLMLFLIARSGFAIEDVAPIGISANGVIVSGGQSKPETAGVAIRFSDPRHGSRVLTYFALNLQNSRLQRKPGTLKYLNELPAPVTLVKSASYLMHKGYFSTIRDLILSKSTLVIEDDSGIPYRYFDQTAWDLQLFGSYSDPIQLFKNWRQDDLKAAFEGRNEKQPLDFAIGYRHTGQSNLIVATRRRS
ncbi:MAG: hypothetical protein JO062_02110 [Bryobacterales bacterium]|nr:hypothetical protein [Bryobacterales bacterium]